MRKVLLLAVAALFASVIGFSGCAKKEAPPPPPPAEQPAAPADNAMKTMDNTAPAAPAAEQKPMEEKK